MHSARCDQRLIGVARAVAGLALVSAALATTLAVAGHRPASAQSASQSAPPVGLTNRGDDGRDGWYPDEPGLSPQVVGSSEFGQLFSTPVNGQVYAQPLLDDGVVIVATETDWVYGLDPATGAVIWSRQVGTAFADASLDCGDLVPSLGVTSTPVVDPSTGVVYLVDQAYVSGASGAVGYFVQAMDPGDGAEEPGFPVQIAGAAQNNPNEVFTPTKELQRAGLLLLGGVVYMAFSSHCDIGPYSGLVVGVSTAGHQTTMWTDEGQGQLTGGGIWQSGGGLVSDGPDQILLCSGNGEPGTSPSGSIAGDTPPADLSEAVVRLVVQPNGSLKATDFFTPYDAGTLDDEDLDFGSDAPVALPPEFGTAQYPDLTVAVGKEGYVYLLDRDNLGGVGQGPGGGDGVLDRLGPNGGAWATPGAWPGDGGYVYVTTGGASTAEGQGSLDAYQFSADTSGHPSLSLVGKAAEPLGFGSTGAIVSSDGTNSGSALVWVVNMSGGSGADARLQAYLPVPTDGTLQLVGSWPVGTGTKFNAPGIGGNRVYVATQDGHVLGFGAPVSPTLTAGSVSFPATVDGQSSTQTLTLTATTTVTVTSVFSDSSSFVVGTPAPGLPATLGAGGELAVPLTFAPSSAGDVTATITVLSNSGQLQVPVDALGLAQGPHLVAQTAGLSLGGAAVGTEVSGSVDFSNYGSGPLTVTGSQLPLAPFSVTGVPAVGSAGAVVVPGGQFTATVMFEAQSAGSYQGTLVVDSDGGDQSVTLTAVATAPSALEVSSTDVDFGGVPVGGSTTKTFTVSDVGGSVLTIEKSKPPAEGSFLAQTSLAENSTLQPGGSLTLSVTFEPQKPGEVSDQWVLNANGTQGLVTVTFTGNGTGSGIDVPAPSQGVWQVNGSASAQDGTLQLTPAATYQVGSAFYPTPVPSAQLTASFVSTAQDGTGADGSALVLADPTDPLTSLGATGSGLGYGGVPGLAVALGEYPDPGTPGDSWVGVADGQASGGGLQWLKVAALPGFVQGNPIPVVVSVSGGTLSVWVSGQLTLSTAVSLPPTVRVGFSAGTGALDDQHLVSDVSVVAGTQSDVPSGVGASAGNHSATVSWTAPSAPAGASVSLYAVRPSPGCSGCSGLLVAGSHDSTTVSGLTDGTSYSFTVVAVLTNGVVVSSSPSNSVTPSVPLWSGVSASAGTGSATVWWTAPAAPAGATVSLYAVRPSPGCSGCSGLLVAGSHDSTTVSGLTDGISYSFTVVAVLANGSLVTSAPSNSVTPTGAQ